MLETPGIDHHPSADSRLGDFLPAIAVALAGGVGLAILTLSIDALPGHYLVVAGSPAQAARIAYLAGGMVIDTSGLPNAVIAVAEDIDDFRGALRSQGAWLVLPAPSAGCFAR